ncbi:MAG: glucosamine-6-phosphate deaminase, partial [Clostridiales bacterium]|nr:glucosamine-6-phosphate deaminase [Clostridiales bacterium]
MRVYKVKNYDEMSRKAAGLIASMVLLKPDCVLGLATGSTPEGIYKELIRKYNNGDLDFSEIKSVNLDEYQGLASNNDQSYNYYMTDKFFNHINIKKDSYYLPNGLAKDPAKECARYEEQIRSLGGVDLQLLGIGINGHIGFNEP